MSSGIPPAIPPELTPTKPPDPLDAMVDYVLALREEVIAAKFIFGFTASEWARISALIGPLPESVLVVLHDSTPDPDAKPLTDHGLSAGERDTTRARVPNANQRGLSLADAQALAIKQNARLLVEAGRYTLVRDEDAARVSRDSLQEVIALLRAPIPEPHEPPPRVRRTCPKRGLSKRSLTVSCGPTACTSTAAACGCQSMTNPKRSIDGNGCACDHDPARGLLGCRRGARRGAA